MKFILLKITLLFNLIILLLACDLGSYYYNKDDASKYIRLNRKINFEELIGVYELKDTTIRRQFKLKPNQKLKISIKTDTTVEYLNVLKGNYKRIFTDTIFLAKFNYNSTFRKKDSIWQNQIWKNTRTRDSLIFLNLSIIARKCDSSLVLGTTYYWPGDPGLTRKLRYWKIE